MQSRRRPFPVVLRRLLLLSLLPAAFAACDRHPAGEAPEAYGHGSSREKSYNSHEIDSSNGTRHFSDSAGVDEKGKAHSAPKSAEPAAAGKRLNPGVH